MRLYILFHHVYHVYVSMFSLYFTILSYVYVSKVLTLFHHDVCLCIHAFALFHHIFICLCFQGTSTISPYWYVMYPCFLSISPYFRMFMFPRYSHYFTISFCMFMFPRFSLYFTILSYVYVSKVLTLFHDTDMFMYPSYSHYFNIFLYVYVSMFSLYFTISFLYVYVSMLSFYFAIYTNHICLCIQITGTISPYMLCVYVSMFLYYFTIYINHICYVSILLTLFHHINFFYMFMFPYIHVFAYEH
jgi:hypothetical protein